MTPKNNYDVVVVGAGPAGSSAAFELARQGVEVALVEKASMPRYKTCGGGIVSRVLKILPFDVSEVIERQCNTAELNLADAGLRFSVKREYPLVSMTMRENFDHLLFQAAGQAGAHTVDGCRVVDIAPHNGQMEVITDKNSLFCRFVIGADGAQSVVARKGGWRERMKIAPLIEWEVSVPDEIFTSFTASARFEFGPVPAGYAWIFPKKRHLSIGLGGYRTGRIDLKARLQRFLQASGIETVDKVEQHGYFIPFHVRTEGLAKGRILLAGDAAGFVDPVTGEGLTYAVLSGRGAARAICSADFIPEGTKAAYQAELSVDVLRELRWGKPLAALLYRSPKVRTLLFSRYGQQLSEAFADVITGKTSYAALWKKHAGLRRLAATLKLIGVDRESW